jgi:hypothetical protein
VEGILGKKKKTFLEEKTKREEEEKKKKKEREYVRVVQDREREKKERKRRRKKKEGKEGKPLGNFLSPTFYYVIYCLITIYINVLLGKKNINHESFSFYGNKVANLVRFMGYDTWIYYFKIRG